MEPRLTDTRSRHRRSGKLTEGQVPPKSMPFPTWITVSFVLIIGLILWIGVLSDASGHFTMPGSGSLLYVGGVICVTVILVWLDRRQK